jgi:GDP-D-mannose dehydratase
MVKKIAMMTGLLMVLTNIVKMGVGMALKWEKEKVVKKVQTMVCEKAGEMALKMPKIDLDKKQPKEEERKKGKKNEFETGMDFVEIEINFIEAANNQSIKSEERNAKRNCNWNRSQNRIGLM